MVSLSFADLPQTIPIFPLQGVLLLPGGQLPLNIFEPRYRAMVEDAMAGLRLIGMIQPRVKERLAPDDRPEIYQAGCAGKITAFSETGDGRYLINLTGVCRFGIKRELPEMRGYRRVEADWAPYAADVAPPAGDPADRADLLEAFKAYLARNAFNADWPAIEKLPTGDLVLVLAASCPFAPPEKQALLEAPAPGERARILISLLAMGARDDAARAGEAKRNLN
jgi:hypothetical protein